LRYKLTIEYDGTRYSGWQVQKKDKTVQGTLLDAAYEVFKTQQVELYGAGRTDAGVHARGQVAHLDVPATVITPAQVMIRMNDELPFDINILSVEKANPKFHARYDAKSRYYIYEISKRRDAFAKKHVWWVRDPLDIRAMRQAAAFMQGFKDFRSFGDPDAETTSTLVDLKSIEILEDAERIYLHLKGSHFLWKMVRRITGVLVEVGRGKMTPQMVEKFMQEASREPAKYTAPPSGLFLERVDY
jgi:tRNA pseudouridine38-40 synthase